VSGVAVWLGAGALGAVGAVARLAMDGAVARRAGGDIPWGTMAVNVLGCLALGWVTGRGVEGDARFLVAGGLIGSFTTFSTWMLETHRLAQEGEDAAAAVNLVLSVGLGLGALALGWWLGSLG
jgi:fluoride exporter